MTVEEMRMSLLVRCSGQTCGTTCPAYKAGVKCGQGANFMKKDDNGKWVMSDKAIEKTYKLMFKESPFRGRFGSSAHTCPYNSNLLCESDDTRCPSCGWHPEERERRKKRLKILFSRRVPDGDVVQLRLKRRRTEEE